MLGEVHREVKPRLWLSEVNPALLGALRAGITSHRKHLVVGRYPEHPHKVLSQPLLEMRKFIVLIAKRGEKAPRPS